MSETAKSATKNQNPNKLEKVAKPEQSKKTTKKSKKGLIAALVAIIGGVLAVVIVIVLLNGGYDRKPETFTIKNDRRGSAVTFEFAAEALGYETKNSTDGIRFAHPENKSNIIVRLYDVYKQDLIKPADAFSADQYRDWSEVKFGGLEGYKIFRSAEDLADRVEIALVLDMYDEEKSRVDGITIMIEQSPTQSRDAEFNPFKFYESEDFKHLLETIKLTIEE